MTAFLEHKTQLWKSVKHCFIEKLLAPSTADSIATTSTLDSDCDLDTENDSLINLSPIEVMPKAFIRLVSSADVQPDPTESELPLDLGSNETLVCLLHAVQIFNSLPTEGEAASPIEITTKRKEDLTRLWTFGCRVWVRPPGQRPAKF